MSLRKSDEWNDLANFCFCVENKYFNTQSSHYRSHLFWVWMITRLYYPNIAANHRWSAGLVATTNEWPLSLQTGKEGHKVNPPGSGA